MSTFDWPATLVPRNILILPPRRMIGRQTSDDGMALKLTNLRYGGPSVTFVEDFAEGLYA